MPCCTRNLAIVFAVLTAFLCAGSAVLAWPEVRLRNLVTQILNQRIITSKNSSGYAQWVSSDFKGIGASKNHCNSSDAPIQYFNVYAFNVTNPDEVTKGAKPKCDRRKEKVEPGVPRGTTLTSSGTRCEISEFGVSRPRTT